MKNLDNLTIQGSHAFAIAQTNRGIVVIDISGV
jgi:hypothetical protein